MRKTVATILLTVAVTVYGCSGMNRSAVECSNSSILDRGTVRLSEPQYYLKSATEALESAEELFTKNEKDRAVYMLMRAEADADLALILSRKDTQKEGAKIAMKRARTLLDATRLTP